MTSNLNSLRRTHRLTSICALRSPRQLRFLLPLGAASRILIRLKSVSVFSKH